MKYQFSFILGAFFALLSFASVNAHHTEVIVEEHHDHWHHPDERVYVEHPYHHDHVYVYPGYAYPNYYYDPNYYWVQPAPAVNVNVNIP